MSRIWLVIPAAYEGRRGAGQWKDLQGLRNILRHLEIAWSEFRFDGRNLGDLLRQIGTEEDRVIWYYSFWPEAMEELRRHCPSAHLILRTVNAEALQHWTRAAKDWRRWRGLPRDIYGFFRLLWRDRRSARAAHLLAGIASWDDRHYWSRLTSPATIRTAPYFSPWPALLPDQKPRDWPEREKCILCLPGARDTIGRGHVRMFAELARRPEFDGWRFALSRGLHPSPEDSLPDRIEPLGELEDPWSWLCRVRAVAVLSPYGYGCKTTITDGLAAGARVLVHPRQVRRLSPPEQLQVIPLDPTEKSLVRAAAAALEAAPEQPPAVVQADQFQRALQAWQKILKS